MEFTTRDPAIIRAELDKLLIELDEAKLERRKTLLFNADKYNNEDETIGFFNITKLKTILAALNSGNKLLFEHHACNYNSKIYMNRQRNVVYAETTKGYKDMSVPQVFEFAAWHAGIWYILNDEK